MDSPGLHVVIVGAGIAGLATAASLRRAGHTVDVYDKSSQDNEIGAAIHLPPNACRFLVPWGMDRDAWHLVKGDRVSFLDTATLEPGRTTYGAYSSLLCANE